MIEYLELAPIMSVYSRVYACVPKDNAYEPMMDIYNRLGLLECYDLGPLR